MKGAPKLKHGEGMHLCLCGDAFDTEGALYKHIEEVEPL